MSEYELKAGGKFRALANAQMRGMGLPEVIVDGDTVDTIPVMPGDTDLYFTVEDNAREVRHIAEVLPGRVGAGTELRCCSRSCPASGRNCASCA